MTTRNWFYDVLPEDLRQIIIDLSENEYWNNFTVVQMTNAFL